MSKAPRQNIELGGYYARRHAEVRLRNSRSAGDFLDSRLRDAGYLA